MSIKRFLLLAGSNYYPAGWSDFAGLFSSLGEAIEEGKRRVLEREHYAWAEIADLETGMLAYEVTDEELRREGTLP